MSIERGGPRYPETRLRELYAIFDSAPGVKDALEWHFSSEAYKIAHPYVDPHNQKLRTMIMQDQQLSEALAEYISIQQEIAQDKLKLNPTDEEQKYRLRRALELRMDLYGPDYPNKA